MESHMPIGRWAECAPSSPGWQAAAIVQVWSRPADFLPGYALQATEWQAQEAEGADILRPAHIYAAIANAFPQAEAMTTIAKRASRWSRLDVGGTAVTREQMASVLLAVRGTAPAHMMAALRTWLGGWSTAFRLQRGRHSCRFGCLSPYGVESQEHSLLGSLGSSLRHSSAPTAAVMCRRRSAYT